MFSYQISMEFPGTIYEKPVHIKIGHQLRPNAIKEERKANLIRSRSIEISR